MWVGICQMQTSQRRLWPFTRTNPRRRAEITYSICSGFKILACSPFCKAAARHTRRNNPARAPHVSECAISPSIRKGVFILWPKKKDRRVAAEKLVWLPQSPKQLWRAHYVVTEAFVSRDNKELYGQSPMIIITYKSWGHCSSLFFSRKMPVMGRCFIFHLARSHPSNRPTKYFHLRIFSFASAVPINYWPSEYIPLKCDPAAA